MTELLDRGKHAMDEVVRITDEAKENIELFRPFILENEYVLRADNIPNVTPEVVDRIIAGSRKERRP